MRAKSAVLVSPELPPRLPNGDDYRAGWRVKSGSGTPNPVAIARNELLRLAKNYDRRGDHLDGRSYYG
jgi:hypothetical protein